MGECSENRQVLASTHPSACYTYQLAMSVRQVKRQIIAASVERTEKSRTRAWMTVECLKSSQKRFTMAIEC